jgi:TolA-binding protein
MKSKRNWKATLPLALALFVTAGTGSGILFPSVAISAGTYTGDEMNAARSSEERKLYDLRLKEIEELRSVLGRRLDKNRKVDLYIRLAEAYLEQYRGEFLVEGKVHEKRLAAGVSDSFVDRTRSRPYLKRGLEACEEVIRTGVEHPKLDQIYYFMGVNYDELEDEANAIRAFRTLTTRYPNSPYAGEAYRALGESAYGKNNFREALTNYQAAARNYQGAAYPRLLQKMAWTQYRLRNYDQAIDTMKLSVNAAQSNERFLGLKDEALRDMALFYTERGKVDEALAYFRKVSGDKDYYPKVLERLASQYEYNADQAKASQVYEMLLRTSPAGETGFRVRTKLIELDLKSGAYQRAISRYKDLQIPSSPDDEETQVAAQNLRVMTRKVGVDQHDRFRKTQDRNALINAENFYSLYLNPVLAKDDPRNERPEIQMYLAEVKKDLKKQSEAAALYKEVIYSKDPRYAKTASALWMDSLSESIKSAKASGNTEQLRAVEADYLEATDTTLSSFGYQPEGLSARLNTAQVLAGKKESQPKAESLIRDLIQKAPKSPQALTGSRLLLQIASDRVPPKAEQNKESPEVKALSGVIQELKGNSELMASDAGVGKSQLANQLTAQENRLKIGVIAGQEKQKDFSSAAASYEEFARTEKKRDVAEKAYENAASSHLKVYDYENSTRVVSTWLKRYPDSKGALASLRTTATHAIITGNFEKAARLFRLLGKRSDPNALEASGRLFEGSGNLREAKEDFSLYVLKYTNTPERGAITLSLAQWYQFEGDDSKAVSRYLLCFKENTSTSAECGARLGDLYARLESQAKAAKFFEEVAARGKGKKPDLSPWVGYARYRLIEMAEKEKTFSNPLQLPDDRLKRGLEERTRYLAELNAKYQGVVEANGPWAVAALDRLATWVMNFADEIDRITPPPGATPQAIEGFQKSLKGVSDPLRQQALQSWKTAYQKALSQELLSPVLPEIADRLNRNGVTPPFLAQGFRDKYRLSGQPADGGREGKEAAFDRVRTLLLADAKNVQAWIDYGNLLWGEGKPLLAKIAYERALLLDQKSAAALNNRGVLVVSASGQEDWIRVAEADNFFRQALSKDELFLSAKFNRGSLLNYYRLFEKAKPYWRQVAAVAAQADVYDGLATSEFGLGETANAQKSLSKAAQAGAPEKRFTSLYFEAVKNCGSSVKKLEEISLSGFELSAVAHVKERCAEKEKSK